MIAPTVSVVLPTFNRERTLRRAIQSVLDQTMPDLELIVVDDASTDGSERLVRSIPDTRLRYLRLPRNRGPASARNAGIAAAAAGWIAFQDSDDEWLPTKLEQQWAVARDASPEIGLVLGGYRAQGPAGAIDIRPQGTLSGGDALADVLDGWPIITPTWLVRRELLRALGGFDETYLCFEDWDLAFRLTSSSRVTAVPGPVLIKHSAVDSVCSDPVRLSNALARILQTHSERWQGHAPRLVRRLTHLGFLRYRLGNQSEARASWRRAQSVHPWHLAPYALFAASFLGPAAMAVARRIWPRYAGMAP